MKKADILTVALIVVVVSATLYVYYIPVVDAQLRYNLDDPVIHIKFLNSNSTADLELQFNKFIVNKTFESRVFELQTIEVIEFDTVTNSYSLMITYKDLNEESPDRALADLQERIALQGNETLP